MHADYMNDPYSEHNPFNAICSRGDLAEKPDAGGCYDTKVSEYEKYVYYIHDIVA